MVGALVLVSLALATGLPARDVLVQELAGDTAVVESTIREVRAAVPAASNEEKKEGTVQAQHLIHTYFIFASVIIILFRLQLNQITYTSPTLL